VSALLFVTNGNGEIAIADRIAEEVHAVAPSLEIEHLALVGRSRSQFMRDVGPQDVMPSGGLIAMGNVRNIVRDMRGGLVGLTLAQRRFLLNARGRYDRTIAVGDIFAAMPRDELLKRLSDADIAFAEGRFKVVGTDRAIGLAEVARAAFQPSQLPPGVEPGLYETGTFSPVSDTWPNGCHVCEVEIDPETGMVVNLADFDDFGRRELQDRFDCANLNEDAAFATCVPSTENLCLELWRVFERFAAEYRDLTLRRIRIEETSNNAFDYFGESDECHMAFHFPLMPRIFMALRQESSRPITEILRQTPRIPSNCQWGLFLRNHDELTLEMVTDEERDYMYAEYAKDPRMKLNLGIRRRLAPLLNNGRRQMELFCGLLLSLPGSPILYYGDEIGMGDNIYLGDRDGVRTPMQWSPDRNAGFSTTDPARLYLPVIMDPVYGFQALNVEAEVPQEVRRELAAIG